MMSVIELFDEKSSKIGFRVYCKGASEILLSKCATFINAEGQNEPFTSDAMEYLTKNVIPKMALDGLRTLVVAYKVVR